MTEARVIENKSDLSFQKTLHVAIQLFYSMTTGRLVHLPLQKTGGSPSLWDVFFFLYALYTKVVIAVFFLYAVFRDILVFIHIEI